MGIKKEKESTKLEIILPISAPIGDDGIIALLADELPASMTELAILSMYIFNILDV